MVKHHFANEHNMYLLDTSLKKHLLNEVNALIYFKQTNKFEERTPLS